MRKLTATRWERIWAGYVKRCEKAGVVYATIDGWSYDAQGHQPVRSATDSRNRAFRLVKALYPEYREAM